MESLRTLLTAELSWHNVKGPQQRELRIGDTTYAEVRWVEGIAAEGATFSTADGAWSFDRHGLFTKQVRIEAHGGMAAAFDAGGWQGGGVLETATGARLTFAPVSVMATRWGFSDDRGAWVTFALRRRRILRLVDTVRIEEAGSGAPELPLLAVLGAWLAILARRDSAAGVA